MKLMLHIMQQPHSYMIGDLPLGVRRDGDAWIVTAFRIADAERWMDIAGLGRLRFATRKEAVQAVTVALHAHGAPAAYSDVKLRRGADGVYRSADGIEVHPREPAFAQPGGWTVTDPVVGAAPLFVRSLAEARRAVRFAQGLKTRS